MIYISLFFTLPLLLTQIQGWGPVLYFSLEKGSTDENV